MRQAIVTKYLGPTNKRDALVKATAQAGSVTIPWNDNLEPAENFRRAAEALAAKYNWTGRLIGGGLPDGHTVFVFED